MFDMLKYFRAEVEAHIRLGVCPTGVCPDAARKCSSLHLSIRVCGIP